MRETVTRFRFRLFDRTRTHFCDNQVSRSWNLLVIATWDICIASLEIPTASRIVEMDYKLPSRKTDGCRTRASWTFSSVVYACLGVTKWASPRPLRARYSGKRSTRALRISYIRRYFSFYVYNFIDRLQSYGLLRLRQHRNTLSPACCRSS